ncbi:hypothetical protein RZS08_02775, partial [Arthrospira platensis SPKY1]|nr:hypothetical protein [Arthrospira platensis SPKY1]
FGIVFEESSSQLPEPPENPYVVGDGGLPNDRTLDPEARDRAQRQEQAFINDLPIVFDATQAVDLWKSLGSYNGIYNQAPTLGSSQMPNIGVYRFEGGRRDDRLTG